MEKFEINEIVACIFKDSNNEIVRIEVGKIKSLEKDGAFIYYHTGSTANKTRYEDLYKIQNRYAIENLGGLNYGVGVIKDDEY